MGVISVSPHAAVVRLSWADEMELIVMETEHGPSAVLALRRPLQPCGYIPGTAGTPVPGLLKRIRSSHQASRP